jgi:tetratricopeptide (TPR) repeat protein
MDTVDMPAPLRAVVFYNRGLSQQKLGRPAMAIEDFTSALLLDPELAQAYLSRASVLRQSGQYLFALGDYEKALRYSHAEPHLALYGQALTYEAQRASLARQRDELLTASLASSHPDVAAKVEAPEPPPQRNSGDIARIEPTGDTAKVAALVQPEELKPEPEPEPARQTELEGWMVQLSSQRNEAAAWSAWDELARRHGELLGGRDAAVVRAEIEGKGVFYRLRVHRLDSRSEAKRLCSRLKARGTACYFGRAES